MKKTLRHCCLLVVAGVFVLTATAQPAPTARVDRAPLFESVAALRDTLHHIAALPERARASALDGLWTALVEGHQVPFAVGDSALLLYRGEANAVAWAGDFTGWQPRRAGRRINGTDVWTAAVRLPPDARTEYKIVVDGTWRLDPSNPVQSWSGFGPNSDLRMPAYVYPAETLPRADVRKGALSDPIRLSSDTLGYDVQVRVYTPAGYDTLDALAALYATDGHEYAPDHLGGLITTLDNLIADGEIAPVVAVFIDPRNPDSLEQNRRETEFIANPLFVSFVADELVPYVEAHYRVRRGRDARVILGTSFGGFFAAYLGATRPDVFARLAIQSPAFQLHPQILDAYAHAPAAPYRISLSQGTLFDGDWARRLRGALEENGYAFTYAERNEGHAWAHWRALLPGVLRYHFGLSPAP